MTKTNIFDNNLTLLLVQIQCNKPEYFIMHKKNVTGLMTFLYKSNLSKVIYHFENKTKLKTNDKLFHYYRTLFIINFYILIHFINVKFLFKVLLLCLIVKYSQFFHSCTNRILHRKNFCL
jgi:hypothetical protein